MKKRTFIATIAVALIAGISIFVACKKEEKKSAEFTVKAEPKSGCYNQYFGDDTIALGVYNPVTEDFVLNFDFDDLASMFEAQCLQDLGMDVVLEDFQIIDEYPGVQNYEAEYKMSFYIPDSDASATMWFSIEKFGPNNNSTLPPIYYVVDGGPDGGGSANNQPNFICKKEFMSCVLGYCLRTDNSCICIRNSGENRPSGCKMVPVATANNNSIFSTIISAITSVIKLLQ